jgi:hypothetical protein
LYVFRDSSDELLHYWSTTCGGGTFKGKTSSVISLFQRQVPNYGELIQDTNLGSSGF